MVSKYLEVSYTVSHLIVLEIKSNFIRASILICKSFKKKRSKLVEENILQKELKNGVSMWYVPP